jgi:hypothetical protein
VSRGTGISTIILKSIIFLALAAFALGQEPTTQPGPEPPSNVVGPPLIVWSQTQQPQPIPETVTVVPPDQQQRPSQQPDAQALAGTTLKDDPAAAKRDSQLPKQEIPIRR